MPDPGHPPDEIHIGDLVTFRLSGEAAPNIRGKVLALLNTLNGETLADIEWEQLGPSKRLNVTNLIKS